MRKIRCNLAWWLAPALCVAGASPAWGDSLTDNLGPRAIGAGESMRADARDILAIGLNPAGLALGQQLVFEAWYGFRPGDSASHAMAAACDATTPVAGCFHYRYFVAEPEIEDQSYRRRVHEFGVVAARALGERVAVGVGGKYFDYNADLDALGQENAGDASGFALDVGTVFRATDALSIAAVGYNLVAADSAQYPLAVAGGLALRPSDNLAIGADGLWNLEAPEGQGTGRYSGGAALFLRSADGQSGYPIRAGVIHDVGLDGTFITGGLGYVTTKLAIDIGARKQVAGGDELFVLASLRLFGPSVTALQ